jgi:tetratricopeptide (TPR) repeat protein
VSDRAEPGQCPDPGNALAYANLGTALLNLGRYDEALAACRHAMNLKPQGAAVHASLGGAMLELGTFPEAVALGRQAVALDPVAASACFNFSHTLKAMNQLPAAAAAATQAIALAPQAAEYHFHLVHILLLQGDSEAGWEAYEWRWKLSDFAWTEAIFAGCSQPIWTGEAIEDRTVLIYTEQGFGDIIQFARYLPLAARRAKRVIVAAYAPVSRLLRTIRGLAVVPLHDAAQQDFDARCPLLSLQRTLGTCPETIPSAVPYLVHRAICTGAVGRTHR